MNAKISSTERISTDQSYYDETSTQRRQSFSQSASQIGDDFDPSAMTSIDDVIHILGEIIQEAEVNSDPLGYFAVLYQKVTIKVKEGIENNFFENGKRMEELDIRFAGRYLKAYFAYRQNKPVTASWRKSFEAAKASEPTVIQHLLLGINAHINLDLGISAAEVCKHSDMEDFKNDFTKIDRILSSLVDDVQQGLLGISPFWSPFINILGRIDNFFINLIISTSRRQAWKFAKRMVGKSDEEVNRMINRRDRSTARKGRFIGNPGALFRLMIRVFKMAECGSVTDKIGELKMQTSYLPVYATN